MVRTIVVIALALFVIGATLPNAFPPAPMGSNLPFSADANFDVTAVVTGSNAAAAGLRVGDHIEPQTMPAVFRMGVLTWYLPRAGEAFGFTVDRAGERIHIAMRQPPAGASRIQATIKRSSASIFIIVAMVLLLLRPSLMTWGFFLYALGSTGGSSIIAEFVGPGTTQVINSILVSVFYYFLGPLGLVIFATHFPAPPTAGLRSTVWRLRYVLAALLLIPSAAFLAFEFGVPLPSPTTDVLTNVIEYGVEALGIVALISGFVGLAPAQRQRLRWVVAGFSVYLLLDVYMTISLFLPDQGWPPAWYAAGITVDVLNGLVIVIPITVAYAVLKRDILDINFVIGRGLVYGILTSIAVAAFALVEWVLGGVLAQTRLAAAGEVIAAIAIGFWLNGLHRQVDRFVDSTIFRKRHLAERRLAEVAAGLPHAKAYETVASLLVREPTDALGLSSAALYRRSDSGAFRCDLAVGAEAPGEITIVDGDALSVRLHGARGPISLHNVGSDPQAMTYADEFVVALPVFVRHELAAIAFYGSHVTGEAIDPDEMQALQYLCTGASAALDHLEATELRRRLDESERTVAALRVAALTG